MSEHACGGWDCPRCYEADLAAANAAAYAEAVQEAARRVVYGACVNDCGHGHCEERKRAERLVLAMLDIGAAKKEGG